MKFLSKYKALHASAFTLSLALPLCFLATTAFAGFEWVPSSASRTTPPTMDNALIPDESGMPQLLVPNVEREVGEGWGDAPSVDFESRPQMLVSPESQVSLPVPGEAQVPSLVTKQDKN